jgi:hypothetical protein
MKLKDLTLQQILAGSTALAIAGTVAYKMSGDNTVASDIETSSTKPSSYINRLIINNGGSDEHSGRKIISTRSGSNTCNQNQTVGDLVNNNQSNGDSDFNNAKNLYLQAVSVLENQRSVYESELMRTNDMDADSISNVVENIFGGISNGIKYNDYNKSHKKRRTVRHDTKRLEKFGTNLAGVINGGNSFKSIRDYRVKLGTGIEEIDEKLLNWKRSINLYGAKGFDKDAFTLDLDSTMLKYGPKSNVRNNRSRSNPRKYSSGIISRNSCNNKYAGARNFRN